MKPYFSQCTLNLAEKIIVGNLRRLVVDVVDGETQLLHLLKVIVELKCTRELWAQAILHVLSAAKLCKQHLSSITHESVVKLSNGSVEGCLVDDKLHSEHVQSRTQCTK